MFFTVFNEKACFLGEIAISCFLLVLILLWMKSVLALLTMLAFITSGNILHSSVWMLVEPEAVFPLQVLLYNDKMST